MGAPDGAATGGGRVMLRGLDCDARSSLRWAADGGGGSSKIVGYRCGILWVSSEMGWFLEVLVFPPTMPAERCE